MKKRIAHGLLALVFATCAPIAHAAADGVRVANAWARASAPGQKTAVVYMDITSDTNAALVGAESPRAGRVELHSMKTEGGVMRMRSLAKIELPRGKMVRLAPNGAHLMLVDVRTPLKAGETLAIALRLEAAGKSLPPVRVHAEVRGLTDAHEHKH